MFQSISAAPPDPILGLTEAFKKDTHADKINLGVGVYQDASGTTPILDCVRQAEQRLLSEETTKSYLGIDGIPKYGQQVRELLWGESHEIVTGKRAVTAQTPGGTGALRVAADFIHNELPKARIWCSQPTWANHGNVFAAAGVATESYPYFDASSNGLNLDSMLEALRNIPAGEVVLLHACCHNPTGIDPTPEQWKAIAEVIAQCELLPLVDFAYQGFGDGLNEDRQGLLTLCEHCKDLLICTSFSKNFGLYRERVGALTAVASDPDAAGAVLSQIKRCVRANYSNPPAHGAAIVSTILADASLRQTWESELSEMRERVNGMRTLFVQTMQSLNVDHDFTFIEKQRGMFSFSGLSRLQVDELRNRHSIYVVGSGRVNVAGMTESNMPQLCEAIAAVLS